MNIAQLLHSQTNIQTIPHWPHLQQIQLINLGYTLRKKISNTHLIDFLTVNNKIENNDHDNDKHKQITNNSKDIIIELRQIDRRQPKQGQLYQIKTNKLQISNIITNTNTNTNNNTQTQHTIMTNNNWYIHQNNQIHLYRISDPLHNQLHTLLWSSNIITCKASISNYLREKLTQYTDIICNKVQEKVLNNKLKIKQFQLVFTYNYKQGKIRVVFVHNFKLMDNFNYKYNNIDIDQNQRQFLKIREMYRTNFKIGRDQHECIQLLIQQQKANKQNNPINNHLKQLIDFPLTINPPAFNQTQQKNRLFLLKTLQKLHPPQSAQIRNLNIAIKKQITPVQNREYQCTACFCLVVLQQFQHQNMVTSNRIPQIQILRQVKMRKNNLINGNGYDLVPVCSLCYAKFKQTVQNRQAQQKKLRYRSLTYKQKSQKQPSIIDTLTTKTNKTTNKSLHKPHTQKNIKMVSNFNEQLLTKDYTTKTNTTIKQENKVQKSQNLKKYFLNPSRQKNRKQSYQIQTHLDQQSFQNAKILIQKSSKTSNARTKQSSQNYRSFNSKHRKQQIQSFNKQKQRTYAYMQFDKQTDDQLENALEEYSGFGWQAQRNKRIARFVRNKKNKFQIGKCQP